VQAVLSAHAERSGLPDVELRELIRSSGRYVQNRVDDLLAPNPPVLHEAALYGPAGEAVRALRPHTEVSDAAILISLLTYFGSIIGRTTYAHAEADRHHGNLFACLVGDSSKARKSAAFGQAERVIRLAGESDQVSQTTRERIQTWTPRSGLSSAEGLIFAARDTEEGEEDLDRRLLARENELGSVLIRFKREGNALSAVLRDAWDGRPLRTMTKNSPLAATDAHVSILAAITREELSGLFTSVDMANGFGNRFLWVFTERARELPESRPAPDEALASSAEGIAQAVEFAMSHERTVQRDDAARADWRAVYTHLSAAVPGLVGAVLNRAEAQVLRLSLLYALLDASPLIRPSHQDAALALWDYCAASARYIFGVVSADAERIVEILVSTPEGVTRAEMYAAVGGHWQRTKLNRAFNEVEGLGLAIKDTRMTDGRSAEVWKPVNPAN